jgi:ABC-type bacteriocin/lantibiotic exporter with double-glycine peptidase domain
MYIFQIGFIAPGMLPPALAAIFLQLLTSLLLVLAQSRQKNRVLQADAGLSGTVFALFSGIQKIRLAGAENRAFHRWSDSYAEKARAKYRLPVSLTVLTALSPVSAILGSAIIYAFGASKLSLGTYMGFQAAYGLAASALQGLTGIADQLAGIGPNLELARPLMDSEPESTGKREAVHALSGRINLSNLSFRYTEDGPWIIDGMDLSIEPGSYVAIVGTTGCGKSTLIRLLLGFERPQKGAVFYDGKDIRRLDIRSLRRRIGTVLQDGKLFNGSIFHNIVVCAPEKTMETAWAAADTAQISDDIREMPMGMHTLVGGGGVSGGQRQRILIARAVAAKPDILIFDEATSALDNVIQAKVSRALDDMKCTRIVVAHRLSTIRNCERIIVLDGGHIIEDGSYDELMSLNGFFAGLVARQRTETD